MLPYKVEEQELPENLQPNELEAYAGLGRWTRRGDQAFAGLGGSEGSVNLLEQRVQKNARFPMNVT
jgi:hypothetical protein